MRSRPGRALRRSRCRFGPPGWTGECGPRRNGRLVLRAAGSRPGRRRRRRRGARRARRGGRRLHQVRRAPLSSPGENKKNAETAIRTIATHGYYYKRDALALTERLFLLGAAAGAPGAMRASLGAFFSRWTSPRNGLAFLGHNDHPLHLSATTREHEEQDNAEKGDNAQRDAGDGERVERRGRGLRLSRSGGRRSLLRLGSAGRVLRGRGRGLPGARLRGPQPPSSRRKAARWWSPRCRWEPRSRSERPPTLPSETDGFSSSGLIGGITPPPQLTSSPHFAQASMLSAIGVEKSTAESAACRRTNPWTDAPRRTASPGCSSVVLSHQIRRHVRAAVGLEGDREAGCVSLNSVPESLV